MRKLTQDEFIKKAKKIHNDIYDYSISKYIKSNIKLNIICNIHGVFSQRPSGHLKGYGCSKCGDLRSSKKQQSTIDEIRKNIVNIHGDKYSYDFSSYKNAHSKIPITCRFHGVFYQKMDNHLTGNQGCPTCGIKKAAAKKIKDTSDVIKDFHKVHGNTYIYDNINYTYCSKKINITCKKHGVFQQSPDNHLQGSGCPKCAGYGFNPDRPGLIYYIKDIITGLYKIGITNFTVLDRFGTTLMKDIEVLKTWRFKLGKNAAAVEQALHEHFKEFNEFNKRFENNGKTEFFNKDVLNLDTF